jgi:hypothetical protein
MLGAQDSNAVGPLRAAAMPPLKPRQTLPRPFFPGDSHDNHDVTDRRTFRRQLKVALRQACAAYPFAQLEDVEGGLRLHRSPPPIGPRKLARPL